VKHVISTETTRAYQSACQNFKKVNIEFKQRAFEIEGLEIAVEKMHADLRLKRRKLAAIQENKDSLQSQVQHWKNRLQIQHRMVASKNENIASLLGN
jgi:hypothetical protein